MKYYVFKSPRKPNFEPLEVLEYEPQDFIVQQKSEKYGPIEVISEEQLNRERNEKLEIL